MFVVKRYNGQWLKITHVASGDVMRIRAYDIKPAKNGGRVSLACDDAARLFQIDRVNDMSECA
jgi:hypothetical protein